MRMLFSDDHRKRCRRSADIAERLIWREIELVSESLKIPGGDSRHRVHKLFKTFWLTIEFLKNAFTAMLCLILRLAGFESLCQIAPKRIKPCICHFEKTTHECRAAAV